jgi:hypothetical protein
MTANSAMHMGHGQMVEIIACDADRWELVFSEAGKPDYAAPPVADIRVEAIDGSGAVHPLIVSTSGRRASVFASGNVGGANRARVMVMHGDHFHTREALLPGKVDAAAERGAGGGSVAKFAQLAVEAKLIADDTFELTFASRQGAPAAAPAPDSVIMQAIGPRAEDYQIRNLAVRQGENAGALLASGKVKDATYLRLTLKSGNVAEIRSVPLVRGG